MTTATQPTVREQLAEAIAARDEGMKRAEDADRFGWDRKLIDQAIEIYAASGETFSANILRPLVPDDVRQSLWGSRFFAASVRGRIRPVGSTRSLKKSTHNKAIGTWIGSEWINDDQRSPTP